MFKPFLIFLTFILGTLNLTYSQCADSLNVYSFFHAGHSYDVVKENKTWTQAVECAVEREGYLAEINDEAEQDAIFNELANNAGIVTDNTQNQFGTASVWLGGSDSVTEGEWIWDGNNDGQGPQFWSGGPNGMAIDGLYTNWGISPAEPDNSGGQDHLTIIIKPSAVNFSLWNDLVSTNSIYYLIEYDFVLNTLERAELKNDLIFYPNPFAESIRFDNQSSVQIDRMEIYNALGEQVKAVSQDEIFQQKMDVSHLERGSYFIITYFEDNKQISTQLVK
jgi:hypothetical protein